MCWRPLRNRRSKSSPQALSKSSPSCALQQQQNPLDINVQDRCYQTAMCVLSCSSGAEENPGSDCWQWRDPDSTLMPSKDTGFDPFLALDSRTDDRGMNLIDLNCGGERVYFRARTSLLPEECLHGYTMHDQEHVKIPSTVPARQNR